MDLLKGYWQVPLTDRAKQLSAFVMPDGLYQYQIFGRLEGCEAYIDNVAVYSNSWEDHLIRLRRVLTKLAEVNLTVNLAKS